MKISAFWSNKGKRKKSRVRKSRKSKNRTLAKLPSFIRQLLDWTVIIGSVLLFLMILPNRFPGMELLGIAPNWLLIWVVAWSVNRTAWQGALAGIILGLLQDAMTSPHPTHALSLGFVGLITGMLQKQRFIQEDFISVALIVFGMAIFTETVFACQLSLVGDRNLEDIWIYYQKIALASAILSSLWAPVVYYPLNRWWRQVKWAERRVKN
ncbi:MAG: rod shape-determining protein MreD [Nostocaceae cyanobacterium]|nr:rod shape-determining protein MreD [Nostocaceae cyanobacterium]